MKKLFSMMLMVVLLISSLPATSLAAASEQSVAKQSVSEKQDTSGAVQADVAKTADLPALTTTGEVSRIQWLTALTTLFEMSVEEDNYPDNYYSDINSEYEYYYEVMLATEFGLVDVEAGEALCPDDPATREFAAHTLNLCLGYSLDDGESYAFTESAEVAYPMDIQVAIKNGWFTLSGESFLPKQPITTAEKDAMLEYAAEVKASAVLEENFTNTFEFADGVIELPAGTQVQLTDDNELTLIDCTTALKAGDIFGVVQDDIPIVKKVVSLTTEDNKTIVQVESVDTDAAFKEIDIQSEIDVDLEQIQAYDENVTLHYIVGGTEEENWEDGTVYDSLEAVGEQEISAVQAVRSYDIPEAVKKEFDIADGVTATVDCKISSVKPEVKVSAKNTYFKVTAVASFSCNVSVDVLEAMGVAPSKQLVRVPVGAVGFMSATLELEVGGSVTFELQEKMTAGVQFKGGEFRIIQDFKKKAFTIQAEVKLKAGIRFDIGFEVPGLRGSIYGRIGAKGSINMQTYDDGNKPTRCTHMEAYLYASVGVEVKIDIKVWKKTWGKEMTIYDKDSSPVRVSFHYEDGKPVTKCTRDGSSGSGSGSGGSSGGSKPTYKYYTPITSQYGYNGASSGVNSAGEPYTIFTYDLDDYNRAIITSYKGNVSALSIPSALDGYDVIGIEGSVFADKTRLRTVIIPEGVTSIGNDAFSGCYNLARVELPSTLTNLGSNVFANCNQLTAIEIPKSLDAAEWYGDGVFYGCDNLKTVTFEKGVTQIAEHLFRGCPGIESITIPDTVTVIENDAFRNCENLANVKLPIGLTKIGDSAFSDCKKIKNIELPNGLETIEANAFKKCVILEKIVMPNSVLTVGNEAFADCIKLANVELSKGLTELGSNVFANCKELTAIEIPRSLDAAEWYGDGVFFGCDNLKTVTFEKGVTQIAEHLFRGCPGIESITIPDTVTVIENDAFRNCANLKEVKLSSSLKTIGDSAFNTCTALKTIVIPDTVTGMENNVFTGCTKLESAVLSKNMNNIPNCTFQNCKSLKEIDIPENITEIEQSAFEGCEVLTKVTMGDKVTKIENFAFRNNYALKDVKLSNTLQTIGDEVFRNNDALVSITIPDSVTQIGGYCFAECELLSDVKLGNGLTDIPRYTFNLCASLEKVVLPYRIASIQDNAFTNCTNLKEITIPRATTSIGSSAFSYATRLIIYGVAGTYAETYANEVGATFVNQEVKATKVELNTKEVIMYNGSEFDLVMIVTPSDFTDAVSWKSTNEDVVTISDTGVLTAHNVGTATIRVVVGNASATCKVTVRQPVTYIYLNEYDLELEGQSTYQLEAYVGPDEAFDKTVVWSSSNPEVATVDQTGKVTALAKGSAVITVAAQDGSGVTETCNVTVPNNVYVCNEVSEMESTHDYTNNNTDSWYYKVDGAEALLVTFDTQTMIEEDFDFLYIYDAEGEEVGVYTGDALAGQTIKVNGSAVKIKLATDDAGTAWGFKVTSIEETTLVEPIKVEAIQLSTANLILKPQEKGTLTATVAPEEATNKGVVWTSSDTAVATVNKDTGEVTALTVGDTVITATALDGSGISAICNVSVVEEKVVEKFNDVIEGQWYVVAVQYAYDTGLMSGTLKGFEPMTTLTREQFAQILYSNAGKPQVTAENIFYDVPETQWYYNAVIWAYDNSIVSGKPADDKGTPYGVGGEITREQLALMMYKYALILEIDTNYTPGLLDTFADKEKVHDWASTAIQWAVSHGIMSGKPVGDGTFNLDPIGSATRAECAAMMRKMLTMVEE